MWPRPSRSGLCTTRCPSTFDLRAPRRLRGTASGRGCCAACLRRRFHARRRQARGPVPGPTAQTETSKTAIPIPNELALMLAANVREYGGDTVVTNGIGRASSPWAIERAFPSSRSQVEGLPEGFRFHDLRHYLASLIIGKGCDVKVVQSRLRLRARPRRSTRPGTCGPTTTRAREMRSRQHCVVCPMCPRTGPDPRLRRSGPVLRIRCRSTSRTRAGAGGSGSGPPRSCACSRSRSRSDPA